MPPAPKERSLKREGHDYECITWQQDEAVAILTLNRPAQMNAITPALEDELHDGIRSAERDPQGRAIVMTGAGKAFSAGYDISADEPPGPGLDQGEPAERRASQ